MRPTGEQRAVQAAVLAGESRIVVQAGAGSGKTRTMQGVAAGVQHVFPRRHVLYLVYNKAMRREAEAKFRAAGINNTKVCTTGSLSFHGVAKMQQWGYDEVNRRYNIPRQLPSEQAKLLQVPIKEVAGDLVLSNLQIVKAALEAVDQFCFSDAPIIRPKHVLRPEGMGDDPFAAFTKIVLPYALAAWTDISRPRGGRLKLTNTHLDKLYALSEPTLPYDLVILDEAQDTPPCYARIVAAQAHHSQLLITGDTNQQLYCQPIGTMVEVPVMREAADPDLQCSFDGCDRKRDHIESGLCDQHERQARAGLPLTPIATVMKNIKTKRVPIEDLAAGDMVVTYSDGYVYRRGRPVTSAIRFRHQGELVRATLSGGASSAYTPKHQVVVRVGPELQGKHVVYLMRRGDRFRIGRTPFFYGSQSNMFGLGLRAGAERAEEAWVLSVHDTVVEAALAEALAQARFNIPGVRFEPTHERDVLDVVAFWDKYGDNLAQGVACLTHHGRLLDFPLWRAGRRQPVGVRRPFVTAAANLVDGMLVLPIANEIQHRGKRDYAAPKQVWEPATITREMYDGDVVSLEVEGHHTYYADGILTHNSWRGAVDAMTPFIEQGATTLYLSRSFRFGEAIADEANKWLAALRSPFLMTGNPDLHSRVGRFAEDPTAVLCWTNAAAVDEVIRFQQDGKQVHLLARGDQMRSFARAAAALQSGRPASGTELAAFATWSQVQEYAEEAHGGSELKVGVKLIDAHGADGVLAAMDACVPENQADVTVSTGHSAKGREWQRVRVGDDFQEPLDTDGEPLPIPRELAMLSYVTVTRASHQLDRAGLAYIDRRSLTRIPVNA